MDQIKLDQLLEVQQEISNFMDKGIEFSEFLTHMKLADYTKAQQIQEEMNLFPLQEKLAIALQVSAELFGLNAQD